MRGKQVAKVIQALEQLTRSELQRVIDAATTALKGPKPVKPTNWGKKIHTCPRCGHTGPVDPDFGTRIVKGVVRLQSWCQGCRASNSITYKRKTAS
jgi:hypothetical protein